MEKRKPQFVSVDSLRPGTKGHNLTVKVLETKIVLNRPRGPKGPLRVAECLVGDQTGVIIFTAKNEQVDLAKEGAYLILRNAKIDMFKSSMRLSVDQWGKVEEAVDADFSPKTDNNLSLIEYELVTIPTEQSS